MRLNNLLLPILIVGCCYGLSLAHADPVRVISAEEIQRLRPQQIERVTRQTLTAATPTAGASHTADNIATATIAVRRFDHVDSAGAARRPPGLTIKLGEYLFINSAEPARAIDCVATDLGECLETSFRYLAMTDAGDPLDLSLVLESTKKLRYITGDGNFIGNIFVQLKDHDSPTEVKDMSTAIQVVVSAPVDTIKPGTLIDITQTNYFQNVTLAVKTPEEPTVVKLTPARSADPQEVEFGVTRPTLELRVGQDSILGFGLETATVTVQANGVDSPPSTAITVTSKKGRLNQNAISFDADGIARTFVRSRATGADLITAELSPFSDGADSVVYEKPWTWLIAVLLGAIVGIGIRLTMRAKQADKNPGVAFDVSIGLLGGLMTAVLYALGVNILPLPLPNGFSEGLTFLLSALGGWVFPKWLSGLGPKKE